MVLQLELTKQSCQCLFIALERNQNGIYTLFYKKRYHDKASIVADNLSAYLLKLYREDILPIFNLYFQDLAQDTK